MPESFEHRLCLLFDWGNTLMRVFPDQTGPMKSWTRFEIMPNVSQSLSVLHGHWIIALATNAEDSTENDIREILHRTNLLQYIDKIYCFRTIGHKKPSPDFFQYILRDLHITADKVIMIGDDIVADIGGAEQNGIKAAWYNPGELSIPQSRSVNQFQDFRDLPELLNKIL